MRSLVFLIILTTFACNKDNVSYPKSYTFSHIDQSEEALYLITGDSSADELNVNTGTYGSVREEIGELSAEGIMLAFNLQEIELLSDELVRIHIITDEGEVDTTVTYTQADEEIIIEALSDTDIIYYDSNIDAFIVCGFTAVALPGPNANGGSHYNQFNTEDCQEGASLTDHLFYYMDQNEIEINDTVGIMVTKMIYK